MHSSKTKEDLVKLQDKLNEVLADYGDVVPRREYERLEGLNNTNSESLERYKTDYHTLLKEHQVCFQADYTILYLFGQATIGNNVRPRFIV